MKRKCGIIGYGALGRQIFNFLLEAGIQDKDVIFFDDNLANEKSTQNVYLFNEYLEEKFSNLSFYIGLGYKHLEKKNAIINELKTYNRTIPIFVHKTAYVHPSVQVEQGTIIYPNVCVDQEVVIQQGTLINNSVTISHNSLVGESTFIAPGVVICGNVNIGKYCFIGAATNISNNLLIGDNCMTSLGSNITRDIPSNHSFSKSTIKEGKIKLL